MTTRLQPGDAAPAVEARTAGGGTWRLSDHAGSRVWLSFFRYAGCPLCNLRMRAMVERASDFAAHGLTIAAVFQSPAISVEGAFASPLPPFPLLCDPDERLYAAYGCEASLAGYLDPRNLGELARATARGILPGRMEGMKTRLPADFLLDADHIVRVGFYAARIADHIPFDAVDEFLEQGSSHGASR